MKTYNELTVPQQQEAFAIAVNDLLTSICDGYLEFTDDEEENTLQTRINDAVKKAEDMYTPWFVSEYIMDTCQEDIESMAQYQIENALYHDGLQEVVVLRSLQV